MISMKVIIQSDSLLEVECIKFLEFTELIDLLQRLLFLLEQKKTRYQSNFESQWCEKTH